MQAILTIAKLTIKSALRLKLALILSLLLLAGVVGLPLVIKHDETAEGFMQILLSYTMALTVCLLSISTLWIACSSISREIEGSQMQMVVVKPVARWQIWIGKLTGILTMNGALLVLSGSVIFGLIQYRAGQLPQETQDYLRNKLLVARGSARPVIPDYQKEAQEALQDQLNKLTDKDRATMNLDAMATHMVNQVKAAYEQAAPGYGKSWVIDLSDAQETVAGRPIFLRAKFYDFDPKTLYEPMNVSTYRCVWRFGNPESAKIYQTEMMSLAANTYHEIVIPPDRLDADGKLYIEFYSDAEKPLFFQFSDGLEALYREGGFAMNFFRGQVIILLWITLLAIIGLAASSFLSFPVASFVAAGIMIIGFSGGVLTDVVEQGAALGPVDHETGMRQKGTLDYVVVPFFTVLLQMVNLVLDYNPVESISSGRSVTWKEMFKAITTIGVIMGGAVSVFGIVVFSRREMALPQNNG